MLLFMQIARAAVDAARKIIWSVLFCSDPSLDTENTLLAFRQDAKTCAVVSSSLSFPFFRFVFSFLPLFPLSSTFQELSNFLYTPFGGKFFERNSTVCPILSSPTAAAMYLQHRFFSFIWSFKEALLAAPLRLPARETGEFLVSVCSGGRRSSFYFARNCDTQFWVIYRGIYRISVFLFFSFDKRESNCEYTVTMYENNDLSDR